MITTGSDDWLELDPEEPRSHHALYSVCTPLWLLICILGFWVCSITQLSMRTKVVVPTARGL